MTICIHSKVTLTQYLQLSSDSIVRTIDVVKQKLIQMYGYDLKLFWPDEKIFQAFLGYKTEVACKDVPFEHLERCSIVCSFDIIKGKCTIYLSWVLFDSLGKPFMRAAGPMQVYQWQLFNPDLL